MDGFKCDVSDEINTSTRVREVVFNDESTVRLVVLIDFFRAIFEGRMRYIIN